MNSRVILTAFAVSVLIVGLVVLDRGSLIIPYYSDGEFFWAEYVFDDDRDGNIIGNPDFSPSFDYVTEETFIDELKNQYKAMNQEFLIVEVDPDDKTSFNKSYLVDEKYRMDYSEGFMILSFQEFDKEEFLKIFKCLVYALDQGIDKDELDEVLLKLENMDFVDYRIYAQGSKIDYRFYLEDSYEVHIEDMKMGH